MSSYYGFFDIQYRLYQYDQTSGVSKERLKKAVVKNYITTDEYKQITGEDYTTPAAS